jgi:hypothetical protein
VGNKRRGLWVAISTEIPNARLVDEGSDAAFKLWVIGIAHARQQGSAGEINPRAAGRLAGVAPDAAEELIGLGKWHRPGHDCPVCPEPASGQVYIHRYLDWQDSPEEIEARTAAGRKAAHKRWAERSAMRSASGSNTEEEGEEEEEPSPSEKGAAAASRAAGASHPKRATSKAPGWIVGDEPLPEKQRLWLEEQGATNYQWVVSEGQQMQNWVLANGRSYKDWQAAWRNWIVRALGYAGARRLTPTGEASSQEEEQELREWLRVNPVPIPAEVQALEDDAQAWHEAMVPLRAAHRERGLAEIRRSQMRSVR